MLLSVSVHVQFVELGECRAPLARQAQRLFVCAEPQKRGGEFQPQFVLLRMRGRVVRISVVHGFSHSSSSAMLSCAPQSKRFSISASAASAIATCLSKHSSGQKKCGVVGVPAWILMGCSSLPEYGARRRDSQGKV